MHMHVACRCACVAPRRPHARRPHASPLTPALTPLRRRSQIRQRKFQMHNKEWLEVIDEDEAEEYEDAVELTTYQLTRPRLPPTTTSYDYPSTTLLPTTNY